MFVAAFALTSLGFVLAWRMESTQGFHAIMNLLLMPMWLLSGAFFPAPALSVADSPSQIALHWVVKLNPVSYCVAGVRQLLVDVDQFDDVWMPGMTTCWIVAIVFALLTFGVAWKISEARTTGDLL